jgi:hypothetical protein
MSQDDQSGRGSLSDRVLKEIQARSLAPVPRWRVRVQMALQWCVLVLLALAAGLSVGLLCTHVLDLYWTDMGTRHSLSDSRHFVNTMLLWVIICAACTIGLYRFYRRTRRGYKTAIWVLSIWLSLGLTLVAWLGFQFAPLESFEQGLARAVPWYPSWDEAKLRFWQVPAEGRLSGMVAMSTTSDELVLNDGMGGMWTVDISAAEFRPRHRWGQGANRVGVGSRLRIRGELVAQPSAHAFGVFRAAVVYPWVGRAGMHGNRFGQHGH